MEVEGRWIITIMTVGAFMGHIIWWLINYALGTGVADASLISFFIGALLLAPTYTEVENYWRKKYGE